MTIPIIWKHYPGWQPWLLVKKPLGLAAFRLAITFFWERKNIRVLPSGTLLRQENLADTLWAYRISGLLYGNSGFFLWFVLWHLSFLFWTSSFQLLSYAALSIILLTSDLLTWFIVCLQTLNHCHLLIFLTHAMVLTLEH